MKEALPPVTVLILNYNGKFHLKKCIDSVLETDYPNFEIVIVDNGSTDGSVDFIRKTYPNVKAIAFEKNFGFAEAYNRAIRKIKTEIIMLLNNDIIVDKNWLKELVKHVSDTRVASATCKMKFLNNKEIINSAGGSCDIYGVAWARGNGEKDIGQYDQTCEVFYVSGATMMLKKSVWRDVGPFDSRYFMYAEELDWCWRARLKGYKILYVPKSVVFHKWHGTSSKTPFIYLLERNWLCNLIKNYNTTTIVQLIPAYLLLKMLKFLWLAFKGARNEKLAVPKAILWNLKNLKGTLRRRAQIQATRKVPDEQIQKLMQKRSYELSLLLKQNKHPILQRYESKSTHSNF
ncbi:MAG: glycosyltransferase family 2 protein [Candidatus Baldrarchaeia archaeon]